MNSVLINFRKKVKGEAKNPKGREVVDILDLIREQLAVVQNEARRKQEVLSHVQKQVSGRS